MDTSNNNRLNILDLPNEILFMIVNKLNISHVVYSLFDVDERFAQIVLDPLYILNIRNLDMTVITMKSFFDYTFSIDDQVLNIIYEKILPQIYNYINKLTIEQHSMERILLTVNYPQLHSLSLVNFQEEILFQYLTDYSILRNLLTQQITHLNIDIQNETTSQLSEISSNIFALILSLAKRLIHLNFCQLFPHRKVLSCIYELPPISCYPSICVYELPRTSCMSSSLTELKINVATFDDCLYLLDGYFDYLSKLIINVKEFTYKQSYRSGWEKLPKLKCFSLTLMNHYDDCCEKAIFSLLRRMINLEELMLFLLVIRVDSTYIDGIQLYDDTLIYMSRLNKFTFSIITGVIIENENEKMKIDLSSNEDIRSSFIGRGYGKVGSYVNYEPMRGVGKCHFYSLPYEFEHFFGLNNCYHFQDGIFDKVRCLTMHDTRPFEHQFFKLISHHFPFLKELNIHNIHPQKDKQDSSTLIIFPYLILLNLLGAHADYAEQFLLNKNTHLPCSLDLCITYESLAILTNNFTNDATRLNCSQLKRLHTDEAFVRPKAFHKYFPLL